MNSGRISYSSVAVAVGGLFATLGTIADWFGYQTALAGGGQGTIGVQGLSSPGGKLTAVSGLLCVLFGGLGILMPDKRGGALTALMGLAAAGAVAGVVIGAVAGTNTVATAAHDAGVASYQYVRRGGLVISFMAGIVALGGAFLQATDKPGQTVLDQMEGR
jgi:hypothetical protein